MRSQNTRLHFAAALLAATLVGAIFAATLLSGAAATHSPANKLSASSATFAISETGEVVTILTGAMKTSSPTDVIISLSMECSILTQVQTVGNDVSEAHAGIVAWVEIDGVPVGVNALDNGEVTFCDRVQQQETSLFDDEDATIRSYIATKSAHSFHWIALNLGSGEHTFTVKSLLTAETDDDLALAQAAIGKRTLIVEPTKLANDVTV